MADRKMKLDYRPDGPRRRPAWQTWLIVIVGVPVVMLIMSLVFNAILWGIIALSGER
jgi:hypothetical protein